MLLNRRWMIHLAALSLAISCLYGEENPRDLDAAHTPASAGDFAELSIEDLMNIKVTSVSKKEERVSETASAIYVITQEDIRRAGVTTIADALRMAPGVNVAQVNAHTFAISARGFQGTLSNKLLVLIDGRTVYTPLYAGVYWDVQDTMLEDIERIEVIRGPGATVWGANAVNGVINIITKNSKDTKGVLASGAAGTSETTIDSVRYGGKIGENATYRIFAKYAKRDELNLTTSGLAAHDGWDIARGGARFDVRVSRTDTVIVEGDYYKGGFEEKTILPIQNSPFQRAQTRDGDISGADVLTRWDHSFSERSNMSLQFYYDRTEREQIALDQTMDTVDLDFNHHIKLDNHEIVYGAGYRFVKETLGNTFAVDFEPPGRQTHLFSAFAQDEITILKDKLSVTIGSKFEHNSFTGFEVQPSIKALWRPAKNHTVWSSISRAVRTPEPVETDLRLNAQFRPPVLLALLPNHHMPSEVENSFEAGYRTQILKSLSIDAAAFYSLYDKLRSIEAEPFFFESTPSPPHLTIPFTQKPFVKGETYGGELAATWEPAAWIKISGGYSFLQILLHRESRSRDANAEAGEGQTPEHQFNVRMFVNLPHKLQFDTALYFTDRLETLNIPSYTRLDARLGWQPTAHFDLSAGAQNILRERHEEFGSNGAWIERNVYLKLTLKF